MKKEIGFAGFETVEPQFNTAFAVTSEMVAKPSLIFTQPYGIGRMIWGTICNQ